jgi:hypothetical protein
MDDRTGALVDVLRAVGGAELSWGGSRRGISTRCRLVAT